MPKGYLTAGVPKELSPRLLAEAKETEVPVTRIIGQALKMRWAAMDAEQDNKTN